jgi:hypothetical protein
MGLARLARLRADVAGWIAEKLAMLNMNPGKSLLSHLDGIFLFSQPVTVGKFAGRPGPYQFSRPPQII